MTRQRVGGVIDGFEGWDDTLVAHDGDALDDPRLGSWRGLAEEAPFLYKDVDLVVATCEQAGLARRVARLTPIGVVKG